MKEIRDDHHQQNRQKMKDTMQDLRDDQHLRTSSCLMNSTLGRCPPHPCKSYILTLEVLFLDDGNDEGEINKKWLYIAHRAVVRSVSSY